MKRMTLSVQEVIDILGLSRATIQRMITAGDMPATMVGGKWLIPVPAIEEITQQSLDIDQAA